MTASVSGPDAAGPPPDGTAAPPAVSVIVPAYNTAAYVAEALDSVLAQTFGDYEIIVVNDGSPDTPELERALEPYRGAIRYLVQENRGSSGARNTALRAARGRYVALLDSDDRWHPEFLAAQVAVLEADPGVDVVYPDARRFGAGMAEGERYSDYFPVGGDVTFARVLARECQVYGEVVARREAMLRAGLYDESLESGEDFELWLRMLKQGSRFAYVGRVLAFYRVRGGSHTSDPARLYASVLRVLDKVERTMALDAAERRALESHRARLTAAMRLDEGKAAFQAGDTRTARSKLKEANGALRSWKLSLVLALLRVAPAPLRALYELRRRLEARRGLAG